MRRLLSLSLCLTAGAPLVAQTPTLLYSDSGVNAVDKMGYSVRTAGDLNGDKIPDYIYSSPFVDYPGRTNGGLVRVRSGVDHSLLFEIEGDTRQDEQGYAVNPAGDVNGDGFDDFLVTQLIGSTQFTGSAEVHSGQDGSILLQLFGNNIAYDYYGVSGAGVGDVNADGYDDIAIGAPAADPNGYRSGEVTVYSGFDGSTIYKVFGPDQDEQFGWFVDGMGDVNGDGYADWIAGAPTADGSGGANSGAAYVHSGIDGSLLFDVYGDGSNDEFGWCVSNAGDVNKDGINDFIVGAPLANSNGTDSGTARVFSGADGSVLYNYVGAQAGDGLGWCVRNIGDIDGDGYADFGMGAYKADTNGLVDNGTAELVSGQTGLVLFTFDGATNNAQMGFSIGSAGDIDEDGFDEVLLGAAYEDIGGGVDAGRFYVYDLPTPPAAIPPRDFDRGAGCPGSDGKLPRADLFGRAALGESYGVRLRGALASTSAVINLGLETDLVLGLGAPDCALLVSPLFSATIPVDAQGLADVELFASVPMRMDIVGIEIHHQWIVVDPANNLFGLSFSDDAAVVIGL